MRIFKEGSLRKRLSVLTETPVALEISQSVPGTVYFQNGEKGYVGCLGCTDPRCMFFSESEIECNQVEGFPNDKTRYACPVNAIIWNASKSAPVVDTQKCIHCGICVNRCPVGALYFNNRGIVLVNTEKSNYIEDREPDTEVLSVHLHQINQLLTVPRIGVPLHVSDRLFERIYDKLLHINNSFHNTVGRNLLIELGCKCSMRRIGDVYTRMDAIYTSAAGSFGAIEIEFGKDTLDASRGILDDIAVLHTRYGISKHDNCALVICLQLPNARQGYWQVVRDIKSVEGIQIGTITIGALMILLWNGCILEPEDGRYYIDYDNMDLRQILCNQIPCKTIILSDKKLGILEPIK